MAPAAEGDTLRERVRGRQRRRGREKRRERERVCILRGAWK